jgi:hypothetical protein
MNNEYIIVNKTTIEKKIEELNVDWEERNDAGDAQWCTLIAGQLLALERILHQSTPLIPEIEKAFGLGAANNAIGQPLLSDYISNFKLDI